MTRRRGAAPAWIAAPQPTKITVELIVDTDLDLSEHHDVVRCIRCARRLTAPRSVQALAGPQCSRRLAVAS